MDYYKIKPTDDNVVFKMLERSTMYGSHIHIPDSADTQAIEYGEVIAVGPGRVSPHQSIYRMLVPWLPVKRIPMQVRPGDKIFFGRQTAIRIDKYESHNHDTKTPFKILPESRIFAVVGGDV